MATLVVLVRVLVLQLRYQTGNIIKIAAIEYRVELAFGEQETATGQEAVHLTELAVLQLDPVTLDLGGECLRTRRILF